MWCCVAVKGCFQSYNIVLMFDITPSRKWIRYNKDSWGVLDSARPLEKNVFLIHLSCHLMLRDVPVLFPLVWILGLNTENFLLICHVNSSPLQQSQRVSSQWRVSWVTQLLRRWPLWRLFWRIMLARWSNQRQVSGLFILSHCKSS